jgi:hypothetical protein
MATSEQQKTVGTHIRKFSELSKDLSLDKSIEAMKINKYLNPGYFFLGGYRSTHDSECQKSSMFFFQDTRQQVASSRAQCHSKSMYECRRCQNTPANASVICLLRQSRHVNNVTVHTRTCANRKDVILSTHDATVTLRRRDQRHVILTKWKK